MPWCSQRSKRFGVGTGPTDVALDKDEGVLFGSAEMPWRTAWTKRLGVQAGSKDLTLDKGKGDLFGSAEMS